MATIIGAIAIVVYFNKFCEGLENAFSSGVVD